jgi:hypothetical protein
MEQTFGLICEGVTDQIVIKNILIANFQDPDLFVTELQPLQDATNEHGTTDGNWHKVFQYCESQNFRDAFQSCDYVVIHLDSDVFLSGELPEKYRLSINPKESVENIIDRIADKLKIAIGIPFYENQQNKIIFAIAVHEVECWLLPIYYSNDKSKSKKIASCLSTLNEALSKKESFYIDKKKPEYYQKMAKHIVKMKQSDFKKYIQANPSLQVFVAELSQKTILILEKQSVVVKVNN